ncbi:hypothetical protein FB451DRAFT_1184824 [Mycena latifolia]|nr:hypothetical protein FB451DRAFT_1184824 [Mycena latifolia]
MLVLYTQVHMAAAVRSSIGLCRIEKFEYGSEFFEPRIPMTNEGQLIIAFEVKTCFVEHCVTMRLTQSVVVSVVESFHHTYEHFLAVTGALADLRILKFESAGHKSQARRIDRNYTVLALAGPAIAITVAVRRADPDTGQVDPQKAAARVTVLAAEPESLPTGGARGRGAPHGGEREKEKEEREADLAKRDAGAETPCVFLSPSSFIRTNEQIAPRGFGNANILYDVPDSENDTPKRIGGMVVELETKRLLLHLEGGGGGTATRPHSACRNVFLNENINYGLESYPNDIRDDLKDVDTKSIASARPSENKNGSGTLHLALMRAEALVPGEHLASQGGAVILVSESIPTFTHSPLTFIQCNIAPIQVKSPNSDAGSAYHGQITRKITRKSNFHLPPSTTTIPARFDGFGKPDLETLWQKDVHVLGEATCPKCGTLCKYGAAGVVNLVKRHLDTPTCRALQLKRDKQLAAPKCLLEIRTPLSRVRDTHAAAPHPSARSVFADDLKRGGRTLHGDAQVHLLESARTSGSRDISLRLRRAACTLERAGPCEAPCPLRLRPPWDTLNRRGCASTDATLLRHSSASLALPKRPLRERVRSVAPLPVRRIFTSDQRARCARGRLREAERQLLQTHTTCLRHEAARLLTAARAMHTLEHGAPCPLRLSHAARLRENARDARCTDVHDAPAGTLRRERRQGYPRSSADSRCDQRVRVQITSRNCPHADASHYMLRGSSRARSVLLQSRMPPTVGLSPAPNPAGPPAVQMVHPSPLGLASISGAKFSAQPPQRAHRLGRFCSACLVAGACERGGRHPPLLRGCETLTLAMLIRKWNRYLFSVPVASNVSALLRIASKLQQSDSDSVFARLN